MWINLFQIKSTKVFKNFGTRHSAGLSAATGDNLVVLVSEEDKKVRILKKGKMILQIDALQRNVEQNISHAVKVLETVGAGTLGTLGTNRTNRTNKTNQTIRTKGKT